MAVNLTKVNEHKIRLNIGRVRLLGARFEQSKFSKYGGNNFKLNFRKLLQNNIIRFYQKWLQIMILLDLLL